MNTIAKLFAVCALAMLTTACVTAPKQVNFEWQSMERRVVMMPTDIQLAELTAGGIEVPNAAWTAKAEKFLSQSVSSKLGQVNAQVVNALGGLDQPAEQTSLIKLHEAVGGAVLAHTYGQLYALPTKKIDPKWTLGPSAQKLKARYGADYALFVFMRDSYTSGGRVAVMVVAAAFGVQMQGGVQQGFASLVDLNTGEVVWNNLLLRTSGDMRTAKGARETADSLLQGFPG